MATIEHAIEIDREPEAVWAVLADLDAYGGWNPFMIRASGEVTAGSRLRLTMQQGKRPMTFSPVVLEAEAGRRLRWLGRLGVPGIFDGEHTFDLEPAGPGRTRLTQREQFRGVLVPFLGGMLRETEAAFARMDEALKVRVERAA